MIPSNKKDPDSISTLLKTSSFRFLLISGVITASFLCFYSLFTLKASNQAVCAFIESRLSSVSGPLAREMSLNEEMTSKAIFLDFKKSLTQLGMIENLAIQEANPAHKRPLPVCKVGFLSIEVNFPIRFLESSFGIIQGHLSSAHTRQILGLLALTLFLIGISFRVLSRYMIHRVESSLVQPLRRLSVGQALLDGRIYPAEVREIRDNIAWLQGKVLDQAETQASLLRTQELGRLARQVAHDLRSPLSVLELVTTSVKGVPDENRALIQSSASRIRDILNVLLHKNEFSTDDQSMGKTQPLRNRLLEKKLPLICWIEPLLSEKRLHARKLPAQKMELEMNGDDYGIFTSADPIELQRVVSNLLDNALEATSEGEPIRVLIEKKGEAFVLITIEDQGRGIPTDILPLLGVEGATYGKGEGTGLGLYHARACAEKWGGSLRIASEQGRWTRVFLTLPQCKAPDWFATELPIPRKSEVIVLDDDPAIHAFWKTRFKSRTDLKIFCFKKSEDLDQNLLHLDSRHPRTYLVDYEIKDQLETGLDWIERTSLGASSVYLVTGHFAEPALHARCERRGIQIIPKSMARWIPLEPATVDASRSTHSPRADFASPQAVH